MRPTPCRLLGNRAFNLKQLHCGPQLRLPQCADEGVMSTAEQHRIHARRLEWRAVAGHQVLQLGTVQVARLDVFDHARAGHRNYLAALCMPLQKGTEARAVDRCSGGQNANLASPACGHRRLHARFDAYDRQIRVACPHRFCRRRRGGVAGNDHQLGAGIDQVLSQCEATFNDEALAALAIRCMGTVRYVKQRYAGQGRAQGGQYGEATDARIKYPQASCHVDSAQKIERSFYFDPRFAPKPPVPPGDDP